MSAVRGDWFAEFDMLAEAAAVEERSTHPARTWIENDAYGQPTLWVRIDDAPERPSAARRRLAERAASYESTADRLAAKGFGDDASCMRTVAKELREVARELL